MSYWLQWGNSKTLLQLTCSNYGKCNMAAAIAAKLISIPFLKVAAIILPQSWCTVQEGCSEELQEGYSFCKEIDNKTVYLYNTHIYLRNNSTVFEELEVSFVDLTVANAVLLATRSGASKTDICDRQIHSWHRQLFKYSTVIPILMKFAQRVHTSLKTYK